MNRGHKNSSVITHVRDQEGEATSVVEVHRNKCEVRDWSQNQECHFAIYRCSCLDIILSLRVRLGPMILLHHTWIKYVVGIFWIWLLKSCHKTLALQPSFEESRDFEKHRMTFKLWISSEFSAIINPLTRWGKKIANQLEPKWFCEYETIPYIDWAYNCYQSCLYSVRELICGI